MTEPTAKIITITPQMALKYLSKNSKNRRLSQRVVDNYTRELKEGRFKFNGETIKFNKRKELIDGQHRLSAIMKANIPAELVVVEGLEEDAINTIDIGRKRLLADFLEMRDEKNTYTLAAAVSIVHKIEEKGFDAVCFRNRSPRVEEAITVLKLHPNLRNSVEFIKSYYAQRLAAPSILAVIHYMISKSNKEKAEMFWAGVMKGVGLKENDVRYLLREKLQNIVMNNIKLQPKDYFEYFSKAWRLYCEGKKTTELRKDGRIEF